MNIFRICLILVLLSLCLQIVPFAVSAQDESIDLPKSGFSGNGTYYVDAYNGYKVLVPAEFKLHSKGASTNWSGLRYKEMGMGMMVNFTPMRDVNPQAMYDINFKSYKKDRNFTDVVPIKVKFGNKVVPGFRVKEVNHMAGNPDMKEPLDHHRWHLFAYANGGAYQLSLSGPFIGFKDNIFQKKFDEVMKSFEIIKITIK